MQVSDQGVIAIAKLEGIALGPYLDSAAIWTTGIGHTKTAGPPDPARLARHDSRNFTPAELRAAIAAALSLLLTDLAQYSARVRQAILVPLAPHQFDALVSFDFNTGGILRARLTEQINRGDLSATGFMGWLRPKAIITRRKAEQALFLSGDYQASGQLVPLYDTLPSGRLQYRAALPEAELLALLQSLRQAGPGAKLGGEWAKTLASHRAPPPEAAAGLWAAFTRMVHALLGARS